MAREMIDYLSDGEDDLKISGGDFETGESTYLHQKALLLSAKGDYKQNPTMCVEIDRYIDNDDKTAVKREIAKQFMQDGMTVNDLTPNPESLSDSEVKIFNNSYYN